MSDISTAAAELGRRRAEGQDMREVGKLGGKPRKPRACPRCGAECPSTRLAGEHCRKKRGARVAPAAPAPRPPYPDFAAFEQANGPWVSPETARQAWDQVLRDCGARS